MTEHVSTASGARRELIAQWVAELCSRLEVPPLRAYGVMAEDVEAVVERAANASSMKANPLVLEPNELRELLTRAL